MAYPRATVRALALMAHRKRAHRAAAGRLLAGGIAAALIALGAPAVSRAQGVKTAPQSAAPVPAASALPGNILVADRGSGRILILGPD